MVAGCPSSHQPTRIREETLESGGPLQQKLSFCRRTVHFHYSVSIILSYIIHTLPLFSLHHPLPHPHSLIQSPSSSPISSTLFYYSVSIILSYIIYTLPLFSLHYPLHCPLSSTTMLLKVLPKSGRTDTTTWQT